MKDIRAKIIGLLKEGYCTPRIAQIARKTREPTTTIHYNIKRLEKEGVIKTYKPVFDYEKIEQGTCAFVLVHLSADKYGNPDSMALALLHHKEIESIDICTGDWEMVLKIRTKDMSAYYEFIKRVLSRPGILKTTSLLSMHQVKTEFVSKV